MALTQCATNSYRQEIFQGVHEAADTYKIALYTNLATLDRTTTVYIVTNEVAGPGYVAGGATLANFASGISGNTAWMSFDNPSWPSASFTARGALIYNSSQGNKSVMVIDFGADITASGGTFLIQFPATGATALLRSISV